MSISRREFLGTTAAAGLTATAITGAEIGTPPIPTRTLGKTGARVSSLAMGGGSRFLMIKDEDKAMLGLIDRSAVVSDAPSFGGSSFGGGFGASSSALAPAAEEGLSSIDEAFQALRSGAIPGKAVIVP